MNHQMASRNYKVPIAAAIALACSTWVALAWYRGLEKRVHTVLPGRLIRGAWQAPRALRAIIAREKIKTIVTLTAINSDDAKFVAQERVVNDTGVGWLILLMRGSTATIDQMVEAADLLADPRRQPVFFHCVAGHHRTSLAHAAYLIRHCGLTPEAAWREVASLPWARPVAHADQKDRSLIYEFARTHRTVQPAGHRVLAEVHDDDRVTFAQVAQRNHQARRNIPPSGGRIRGLEPGKP